ncbi:site-specific integrase, partial [Pediococcus acidilactici]|nr:site-specific integrase [Pediococcus acidilactici]
MDWIEQFKRYLTVERQYSDKTVTAYLEDLQEF